MSAGFIKVRLSKVNLIPIKMRILSPSLPFPKVYYWRPAPFLTMQQSPFLVVSSFFYSV